MTTFTLEEYSKALENENQKQPYLDVTDKKDPNLDTTIPDAIKAGVGAVKKTVGEFTEQFLPFEYTKYVDEQNKTVGFDRQLKEEFRTKPIVPISEAMLIDLEVTGENQQSIPVSTILKDDELKNHLQKNWVGYEKLDKNRIPQVIKFDENLSIDEKFKIAEDQGALTFVYSEESGFSNQKVDYTAFTEKQMYMPSGSLITMLDSEKVLKPTRIPFSAPGIPFITEGATIKESVEFAQNKLKIPMGSEELAIIAAQEKSGLLQIKRTYKPVQDLGNLVSAGVAWSIHRGYDWLQNNSQSGVEIDNAYDKYTPTFARDVQNKLIAGGASPVIMTLESVEQLMGYAPTVIDRGVRFTLEVAVFEKLMADAAIKVSKQAYDSFQKYKNRPENINESVEKAFDGWLKVEERSQNIFRKAIDSWSKGNVLRGFDVIQSVKAGKNVKTTIEYQRAETNFNALSKRLQNTKYKKNSPEYNMLQRKVKEANMKLLDVRYLNQLEIPKFIRESAQAETGLIVWMSTLGQISQEMGRDPVVGELMGLGVGISSLLKNSPYIGTILNYTIAAPDTVVKNVAKLTEHWTLKSLEVLTQSKGTLTDVGILPQKMLNEIENIGATLNTAEPALKEYVIARLEAFDNLKARLTEKGLSSENLNLTMAKLTGLAAIQVFEKSIQNEALAKNVFDSESLKITEEIHLVKRQLSNEIRELMKTFDEDAEFKNFINQLDGFLTNLNEKSTEIIENTADYVKFQTQRTVEDLDSPTVINNLNDAIDNIYENTSIRVANEFDDNVKIQEFVNTRNRIALEMATAVDKLRHTNILKYKEAVDAGTVKPVRSDQYVNQHLALMAENQLSFMRSNASRGYKKMDESGVTRGATTDATSLANKVFDEVTGFEKGSKKIVGDELTGVDTNALITQFDAAVQRSIGSKLDAILDDPDSPLSRSVIAEQMKKDGYQNTKSKFFLWHWMNNSPFAQKEFGNLQIPLLLNFQETARLKSGFRRRAAVSEKNPNDLVRARRYREYQGEAQKLFSNFKSPEGVALSGLDEMVREADTIYRQEYADRAFEGTLGIKWLGYERKIIANDDYPTGKIYKNEPSKWLNFDTIAEDSDHAQNVGKELRQFFGKKFIKDGKPEFHLTKEDNADLAAYVRYKAMEWTIKKIEALTKAGEVVDASAITKQLKNFETAFKTLDGGGVEGSLINTDEFFDGGVFSLDWAAGRSKTVKTAINDAKILTNKAIRGELKPVKQRVAALQKNIDILKNFDATLSGPKDFYERVVQRGPKEYDKLKNALVQEGKLTEDQFDAAARSLISDFINDTVFGSKANDILHGSNKNLTTPIADTDFATLETMLTRDEAGAEVLQKVLSKEHYETLLDITRYMNLQKSIDATDNLRIGGIPRSMSVESWISRIYSINRGVISPKYVATEALLQQARVNKFSLIKEIIRNPETADVFKDIILSGQKLDVKMNERLTTALLFSATWYGQEFGFDEIMNGAHVTVFPLAKGVYNVGASSLTAAGRLF